MNFRQVLLYLCAAIAAVILGIFIAHFTLGRRPAPPLTAALQFHPPRTLPAFALTADDGKPFDNAALAGHWSLLYFGYTHCPDACPTTLADLNKLLVQIKSLPAAEQPQVYFISVDPKRDTPALLQQYVQYFNIRFAAATGAVERLRALTGPLGVAFSYDPPDQIGNYGVDHTSAIFLINPRGQESALYTPPLIPERMAADYRAIVNYYGEH